METQDAYGGAITSHRDIPSQLVKIPYVNPQTGPIFIEGAEKGDAIRVEILEIQPSRNSGCKLDCPGIWRIGGNWPYPAPSPSHSGKIIYLPNKGWIYPFQRKIRFPYQPFFGTMATAPELESISTLTPGPHGGNMDLPETC